MRDYQRLSETNGYYQRLLETMRDYKRLKKTMYLYISFYFLYLVLTTPRQCHKNVRGKNVSRCDHLVRRHQLAESQHSSLPEIVRHPQLAEHSIRGLKNPIIFDSFCMQLLYHVIFIQPLYHTCTL